MTISWDNSNIYLDLNDSKIEQDIQQIKDETKALYEACKVFESFIQGKGELTLTAPLKETLSLAQTLHAQELKLWPMIQTLTAYAMTSVSVNGKNQAAKDLQITMNQVSVELKKATAPLSILLLRVPESFLQLFFESDLTRESKFTITYARQNRDFLLSLEEENVITSLGTDGLYAWGKLYDELSSAIKLEVEGKEMGLAEASNLLMQNNRPLREVAYKKINEAWVSHEITSCSILNAINGWRLENDKMRSKIRPQHFLDKTVHQSRISRKTLDAMMSATYEARDVAFIAHDIMAREMNTTKLGPWDLLAPYPQTTNETVIPFEQAMELIVTSFNTLDPAFGEFAKMMATKRWIDTGPSENRRQGAYCTSFQTVREPRVFMTYQGSMNNVLTLAHEIGHAYHSWVMRDLKPAESTYSMTLAETASIFAETLVRDSLLSVAKTPQEKKKILWQELIACSSFLLNIPARFTFEKEFVEKRMTKVVSPSETKELMKRAWAHWYGDSLSEYNEMFWASKLHFSMAHFGFYNYPYLFGYLFSLGIYAQKEKLGNEFNSHYVNLLRDTGRMTADDLVQKHLKADITKKEFWNESIECVKKTIIKYNEIA